MEEEIENERGGVTLGYIFRTIFSQKWLALILATAITVVGALGIYFLGKGKREYSVSFVLQLPNTGDATSTSYTYPDGESFYYTDIISADNLKKVSALEEFKDIDIDKMVKNSDITISRTVDKIDEESKDGVYDLNYTIKVKAKYFKDEDTARDFIETLAVIPREYIAAMNINYDQSLTSSKTALTYSEQLSLLKNQTVYIQSKYSQLVSAYGSEFLLSDGRTLAQCKDEVDTYINKDMFGALSLRAEENGYIKSNDNLSQEKIKYESDKYYLQKALDEANDTLAKLKEFQSSGTIIYDEIISLNRQIATLEQQMKVVDNFLASFADSSKVAPADFEAEVAKVEATVTKFTEEVKPVASYVYGRVTKINYLSSRVVEVEGGTSIIMSLVIGLVAGIVIAAIVAYIVGWSKQKKAEEVNVVPVPVYTEAQLQIAASDESDNDGGEDKKE